LGAFTWLPWAWWGAERALDQHRTKWRFLWPAPFVYLLVTGGFPYTVLMLLLLTAWLSAKSLVETRNVFSIFPMLFGVALCFLLWCWFDCFRLPDCFGGAFVGCPFSISCLQFVPQMRCE